MSFHMSRRTLLKGLGAASIAPAIFSPHVTCAEVNSVAVTSYGGAYEKFFREVLIPPFEKETGATVNLVVGLAKENIAMMRAGGVDNPPIDVVMTNEAIAEILRTEGFFTPLPLDKVPNIKDVVAIAQYPDNIAVTGLLQPIGIAYRPSAVANPPKAWKELFTRPDLAGKLGVYNITNVLGFMFVLLVARLYGGSEENTDAAFAEIAKLKPFNQVDFSGTMEVQLTRGEVDVAPLDFAAVMRLQKQGVDINATVPPEGLLAFDQVFNVSKGSRKKELAFAWVDYTLKPETQQLFAAAFYGSPTNKKAVVPAGLAANPLMLTGERLSAIIRHDWKAANARRDKLVDQWNRMMT
jgi:putative spermidine/putrescine transport system substrate-binding protein